MPNSKKSVFERNINLSQLLKKKSVLLLGPRGTGKSFYIRNQLTNCHIINLLKSSDFLRLNQNPSLLEELIEPFQKNIIVIDEVQKIPALLDEAHRLIEEKEIRFLLTGSSARKLLSENVNLLAGRAWLAQFYPLNSYEINSFSLNRIINFGTLPTVYNSELPLEELDNYVQTYIEAEIKAEGLIRKVPAFSRFLKTAALSSGELLNYQNISSDASVPVSTIKEHYQILEDTLIGYTLHPWIGSKKRKAIATGKFYFFDTGVLNHLADTFDLTENMPLWGNRFENFIINEVRCANSYQRRKSILNFWRSTSNFEVDLIWGDYAIEIKNSRKISEKHLSGLKAIREENILKKYFLVCNESSERIHDGIHIINYKNFLTKIWSGEI